MSFKTKITVKDQPKKAVVLICFIIVNVILGVCSEPIIEMIQNGLNMFAQEGKS